ncbi:MAG: GAF domain-containing sensor histidine kinase [Anaerolineae bacterium]|nr:GAF domain-containing sensor histidine kinase [Anaerolineae bacterium]
MNIAQGIVPAVLFVGYLGIFLVMLFKKRLRNRTERTLAFYLIVSALWHIPVTLYLAAPFGSVLSVIGSRITLVGLVLLAVIFVNLTYAFLRKTLKFAVVSWVLIAVYIVGFVLLTPEIVPLGLPNIPIGAFQIGPSEIIQILSALVWAVFTIAAIIATWSVYGQVSSPMHRNRYRYLLLSLLVLVVGDAFFVAAELPFKLFGVSARFCSALVLALVTLRHTLLDIKTLFRHTLSYAAATFATMFVGLTIVFLIATFSDVEPFGGALIATGIVSLLLSLANIPMRKAIQRAVDRGLFHINADYDAALRAYGEKVIETLQLEVLVDLIMSTLIHTTGIEHGGLYLVREGKHEIGGLLLDPANLVGHMPEESFELSPDSVLAIHLAESDEPVAQYDIDLHETFVDIPDQEREWLTGLSAELLLPIHTSEKLVGLVILGAKRSGEVYTTDEINWLKTLADQTGVALQNARLFDQVEAMSINVMRLNAELELAYKKLQEVDKLKSNFIGVITHELRSPFVSAGFSVQLLERYIERRMFDELPGQVEQLSKELSEGRNMIDKVISFASLLSKQGELELVETDIDALIREAVAPLEKMAQTRDIALSLRVSSELPATQVDRARMSEAVYQLVHNAIRFNREGGSVRIACWPKDGNIVFRVEDTGCGIPAEKVGTIWDAFTQVADDVNRGVEGLGIGLPLVKFVTEAHGGQVSVSSEEGHGSTFGFRIPIQSVLRIGIADRETGTNQLLVV